MFSLYDHFIKESQILELLLLCAQKYERLRFGQLKSNNKFSRFTLRGLEKVCLEFGLMAMAHNLRKMTEIIQNKGNNKLINYIRSLITPFFELLKFIRLKNEITNHFSSVLKFAA